MSDNENLAIDCVNEADQLQKNYGRGYESAQKLLCQASEALLATEAQKDAAYLERNQLVAALSKVFPAGIARTTIEGWDSEWHNCVFIDLPTGQASWHYHDSQAHLFAHLSPYWGEWDGHTTEQKYERLAAMANAANGQHVAECRIVIDAPNRITAESVSRDLQDMVAALPVKWANVHVSTEIELLERE